MAQAWVDDSFRHPGKSTRQVARRSARGGSEVDTAAASPLFMHCNLGHASSQNISPLRRAMHQLAYNSVENPCVNPQRPSHQAARDCTPLEPLAEDCLLHDPALPEQQRRAT